MKKKSWQSFQARIKFLSFLASDDNCLHWKCFMGFGNDSNGILFSMQKATLIFFLLFESLGAKMVIEISYFGLNFHLKPFRFFVRLRSLLFLGWDTFSSAFFPARIIPVAEKRKVVFCYSQIEK